MMHYKTKEGLNYYIYLIKEFLYSDFFTNENNLTQVDMNLQQMRELASTKNFKDFLVQRERDFTLVSSFLANESYELEKGFGSTLEINPGKYECVTSFDDFNLTSPYFVTKYSDPTFFRKGFPYRNGELSSLDIITNKQKVAFPFLIQESKSCEEQTEIKKGNITDFDSIFYLNDVDLIKMCTLINFALKRKVKLVTGLVTNVYDKKFVSKLENFEETIGYIEQILGLELNIEENNQEGSIVKLVHTI